MTFTAAGKQILRDGAHFADAVDADAANLIAAVFNEPARRAEVWRSRGDNDGALALEVLAQDISQGLVI